MVVGCSDNNKIEQVTDETIIASQMEKWVNAFETRNKNHLKEMVAGEFLLVINDDDIYDETKYNTSDDFINEVIGEEMISDNSSIKISNINVSLNSVELHGEFILVYNLVQITQVVKVKFEKITIIGTSLNYI